MTDELIKYDTAVLAKEKGFNEPSLFFYRRDTSEFSSNYISQTDRNSDYEKSYAKCTQSLLQKWLREIHRIIIEASVYYNPNKVDKLFYESTVSTVENSFDGYFQNCANRLKNSEWINNPKEFNLYDTYEEALEIALNKGLNLIK